MSYHAVTGCEMRENLSGNSEVKCERLKSKHVRLLLCVLYIASWLTLTVSGDGGVPVAVPAAIIALQHHDAPHPPGHEIQLGLQFTIDNANMFKKKPNVKPLSPLKSSERRRTADLSIYYLCKQTLDSY